MQDCLSFLSRGFVLDLFLRRRIQQVMASVRSIIKKLSKDDIARSILVSNISPKTKEEALFIHFQQRKHGGGDVSSVVFTQDKQEAIVTFEDADSKY